MAKLYSVALSKLIEDLKLETVYMPRDPQEIMIKTVDINRPLFRAYTSGSTGPSKQVIHSAYTMVAVVAQMNFYAGGTAQRPTWMVTALPPSLVAVIVSMVLMPLSSSRWSSFFRRRSAA